MIPSLSADNLVSYSVQLAVLVGAGALAPALLRLRVPRAMLTYWQVLLVVALLLPLAQPWVPAPASAFQVSMSQTAGVPGRVTSATVLDLAVLVLAAGIGFRFLRLAAGLSALARYRRSARPMATPPEAARLGARLGVEPAFLVSTDVTGPATFGLWRPAILVPPRFCEMPDDLQAAVACHEMLHVRRHDWLFAVLEEVAGALLWFHPAVWWLLGRIRLTREQLVDAEVVSLTGARRAYLEALLDIARTASRTPAPAPLFLKESHLKQRVNLLLEEVSMSRTKLWAALGTSAVAVVVSGGLAVRAFPLEGTAAKDKPASAVSVETGEKGVAGGVAGGVEGGVAGGIPGGVAGGVPGGVAGGVSKAKKGSPRKVVHSVSPDYPEGAKKDKIHGDVVLDVTVQKSGDVSDVQVVRGPEALTESAVQAMRQWRFEPSSQGPTKLTMTIRFALDK